MVSHMRTIPSNCCGSGEQRLGTSEEALSNPLVSASSGALSTAVGAYPVIPFFLFERG